MSKSDGHWFSHDNNTATNPKIICLEAEYGFEGSGRFWRLLEIIHTQPGYKYCLNNKVGYASLAKMLSYTKDQLSDFLQKLVHEFELIQTDGEYIWNESMTSRMEYWGEKKRSLSERGKKGAAVKKEMQAKLNESDSLAEAGLDVNQANETKQNHTKPNETTPYNNKADDDVEVFKEDIQKSSLTDNQPSGNTIALTPLLSPEQLRDSCIDDVAFCATYTQAKNIPLPLFTEWLNAFNRWLVYTADTRKTETEYRKHFRNWFRHRDLAHERPERYNPVHDKAFSKTIVRDIPLEMPRKTAKEVLAEQAESDRIMLEKLRSM